MRIKTLKHAVVGTALIGASVAFLAPARGSDHADTPQIAQLPGTDLTDVFLFPSPENPNNVVMIMTVHPLITPGQATTTYFDPNVLYQFKIDNNGDAVEDVVIQAKFSGNDANQTVSISGPVRPTLTGTTSAQMPPYAKTGTINSTFEPTAGMKVFAGVREDPFFFDLEQFFTILPDRATPLNGIAVPDPNVPKATTWRPPGQAVDFLSNGNYDLLAIVVELPKTKLTNL